MKRILVAIVSVAVIGLVAPSSVSAATGAAGETSIVARLAEALGLGKVSTAAATTKDKKAKKDGTGTRFAGNGEDRH